MSGVAAAVLLAAAFGALWARERGRHRDRRDAARPGRPRPEPAPDPPAAAPSIHRLLGVIAHELRTPLGAIIGFQELLADGLLGPLDPAAADGVDRIGTSATQLRHLLDGLADLLLDTPTDADLEPADVPLGPTLAAIVASAHALASGRGVHLDVRLPDNLPSLHTDPARLACALDLAIGAAIRGSPNRSIGIAFAHDGAALTLAVTGGALDPRRCAPPDPPHDLARVDASGPALRLAMAARVVAILGGRLHLVATPDGSTLHLRVPSLPN